jgi:hypothetical protein
MPKRTSKEFQSPPQVIINIIKHIFIETKEEEREKQDPVRGQSYKSNIIDHYAITCNLLDYNKTL